MRTHARSGGPVSSRPKGTRRTYWNLEGQRVCVLSRLPWKGSDQSEDMASRKSPCWERFNGRSSVTALSYFPQSPAGVPYRLKPNQGPKCMQPADAAQEVRLTDQELSGSVWQSASYQQSHRVRDFT